MASISGLSSSSSIYGSRNILSGLATGMDTESMIENAISGHKQKLTNLQKQRMQVEWKQQAYRDMINQMVNFTQKYTSYASGTNLMSASFFDSAIKPVAQGLNADRVSAVGKTESQVQINSVSKLAVAARYSTTGSSSFQPSNTAAESIDLSAGKDVGTLKGSLTIGYGGTNVQISFDDKDVFTDAQSMADAINKKLSETNISMKGSQPKASERIKAEVSSDGKSIEFKNLKPENGNSVWVEGAHGNLEEKLGLKLSDDADERKKVSTVGFDAAKVKENKPVAEIISEKGFEITLDGVTKTIKGPTAKELGATEDQLKDPEKLKAFMQGVKDRDYLAALQKKIDDAFGANRLMVTDADGSAGADGKLRLSFEAGSVNSEARFTIKSSADEQLGMKGGLSNYVNVNRGLGDLLNLSDAQWKDFRIKAEAGVEIKEEPAKEADKPADGAPAQPQKVYGTDKDGNRYVKDGADWYRVDKENKELYDFQINGKSVGSFTKDSTLKDVMNAINNNDESGVQVAYSEFTQKFTFTAKETGTNGKIDFGAGGLAAAMFAAPSAKDILGEALPSLGINVNNKQYTVHFDGEQRNTITVAEGISALNAELAKDGLRAELSEDHKSLQVFNQAGELQTSTPGEWTGKLLGKLDAKTDLPVYTAGQDAEFEVSVNGETRTVRQSSNTVDIDGLKITMKSTFEKSDNDKDAVTFTTEMNTDKIVDAVKSMVEDYNKMAEEIKKSYSTLPLTDSRGRPYQPLVTEEEKKGMSESSLEAYEKKAKTGQLFADRDLSNLYQGMTQALSVLGTTSSDLHKIGLTTSFSGGATTMALDEEQLRKALKDDPDKVKDIFTRSTENGASSDGLMQGLKNELDRYAGTTGANKGILVEKAGTPLAPTSVFQNELQRKLNDFDRNIGIWQDKISDQIDYYNRKFTALEKLTAQMNNQSGMLMGLMGGY